MSKANRDDALMLIEYFNRDLARTSSRTSAHHAFNNSYSFVVRECPYTLDEARQWAEPALFVAREDVETALRPLVAIYYKMSDGQVLALVIKKQPFATLKRLWQTTELVLNNESGIKVDLSQWAEVGKLDSLVPRRGSKRSPHFARKVQST